MEPKKILIILSLVLFMSIALVSAGIAYEGGVRGIELLGVLFSLTFGVVVASAQLIPAGKGAIGWSGCLPTGMKVEAWTVQIV